MFLGRRLRRLGGAFQAPCRHHPFYSYRHVIFGMQRPRAAVSTGHRPNHQTGSRLSAGNQRRTTPDSPSGGRRRITGELAVAPCGHVKTCAREDRPDGRLAYAPCEGRDSGGTQRTAMPPGGAGPRWQHDRVLRLPREPGTVRRRGCLGGGGPDTSLRHACLIDMAAPPRCRVSFMITGVFLVCANGSFRPLPDRANDASLGFSGVCIFTQ